MAFFHPLSKYPGPFLAKFSSVYHGYYAWRGDVHLQIWKDHQKYGELSPYLLYALSLTRATIGDFVRFSPDMVLVSSARALHDIYGTGASSHFIKSKHYIQLEHKNVSSFSAREKKDHQWRRRIVSQSVSDKAQRGYEPRIAEHINKLCSILYPESQAPGTWGPVMNMAKWCNWLTFDMMSDVVFGAYYNLLGSEKFRYVPEMISQSNVRMSVMVIIPWLASLKIDRYLFRDGIVARYRFLKFVVRCVRERVDKGIGKSTGLSLRPDGGSSSDIFESLATVKDSKTDSLFRNEELASESVTLIVAGSETSSTAIASVLFYLADNKAVYERLASEVRSCGEHGVASCAYLRACIDETMRMTPPNGAVLAREVVRPGGVMVDGKHIGKGQMTGVGIYAIHHDTRNFADPFVFRPERWLEDDGSGNSIERARAAFNPFSLGTRSCVGKSLAYHEISNTIAAILRRGDFRFAEGPLCSVGRGNPKAIFGRHRENEFQLKDHIAGQKIGPNLQFAPLDI